MKFIKTTDAETAKKLRNAGFQQVSVQGDIYTFLNEGNLHFSDEIKNKIAYSNVISM